MWPFRGKKKDRKAERRKGCRHLVLAPRWDRAADVGHKERAVGYWCALCEQPLTLEEAAMLQGQPLAKAA
jgi:hypothetical protein